MFSSAKFLSPIVTAGLPTPGPLDAAVAVLAVVAGGGLLLLDHVVLLLLPHAARPTLSADSATAASTLVIRELDLLHLLAVISRLLVLNIVDRLYYIYLDVDSRGGHPAGLPGDVLTLHHQQSTPRVRTPQQRLCTP